MDKKSANRELWVSVGLYAVFLLVVLLIYYVWMRQIRRRYERTMDEIGGGRRTVFVPVEEWTREVFRRPQDRPERDDRKGGGE